MLQSTTMPAKDWMTWDQIHDAYEKTRDIRGHRAVAVEVARHNGKDLVRFMFTMPGDEREPFQPVTLWRGVMLRSYVYLGDLDD